MSADRNMGSTKEIRERYKISQILHVVQILINVINDRYCFVILFGSNFYQNCNPKCIYWSSKLYPMVDCNKEKP